VTPRGRPPAGGPDNRANIIDAARALFAEHGYDRATIRAIAERATVDPALVYHYFDDKHALLVAALTPPAGIAQVVAGITDSNHAGEQLMSSILNVWDSDPRMRGYLTAMLRTALSHEEGATLMRENQRALALAAVGYLVRDDNYDLRIALIGAQLAGVLLSRYIIATPALADVATDDLVQILGPVVQHFVSEPLIGEGSRLSG
jgi:AcrR family transcriptional regulator